MAIESEVAAKAVLVASQTKAAEAAEAPVRREPPSSHRVYPETTASAHRMHALPPLPRTPHSHPMHTPCTSHATPMHLPCTSHKLAMHTPCQLPMQAPRRTHALQTQRAPFKYAGRAGPTLRAAAAVVGLC